MAEHNRPFFVGYLNIPEKLKFFLLAVSVGLISFFTVSAFIAGATQDDPGRAGFRFDYGRQNVTGIVDSQPYPVLHITEGSKHIKTGKTIMLTGQGKTGVMANVASQKGALVQASGIMLTRGDLQMLQLSRGEKGFKVIANEQQSIPESEQLGKWRLQGEICDGKCLAGAMQPGRGIAHKACANLCIIGDIPPVFVSTKPVEGEEFMLVGGPDGGPLPEDAYDLVGQFIEVEASLERRGDMLVVLIDPEKSKVVK